MSVLEPDQTPSAHRPRSTCAVPIPWSPWLLVASSSDPNPPQQFAVLFLCRVGVLPQLVARPSLGRRPGPDTCSSTTVSWPAATRRRTLRLRLRRLPAPPGTQATATARWSGFCRRRPRFLVGCASSGPAPSSLSVQAHALPSGLSECDCVNLAECAALPCSVMRVRLRCGNFRSQR